MPTLDGTDREALAAWLRGQPAQVSVAIAARSALRVLPVLYRARVSKKRDLANDIVLPAFRAAALAWSAAKSPARATELFTRAAADAAADVAYSDTSIYAADAAGAAAADAAIAAATYAAYAATAAIDADADVSVVASHAAHAAANAANAAAAARSPIQHDIDAIARGQSAEQLVGQKLWPKRNVTMRRLWKELMALLLARPDQFEVWTDWYEARLAGQQANEKLEIARATIDHDLWDQGPSVVNAEIKRLIEEYTTIDPKATKAALSQRPAAFAFRTVDNQIDAAPEDGEPIDPALTYDLYHEALRKAETLRERLERIQADAQLRANVNRLIVRLGDDTAGLRPGLILSALRALQADVRAWDTEEGRKELLPADLSRLVDLAETTRDLASSFPKAREIEAEAVSLDLPERVDEIEAHVGEIVEAIDVSDGATKPAKAAIHEMVAAVPDARTEADRRKQLAYSLLDIGNFARAGLSFVKASGGRLVTPVGKGARVAGYELRGLGKDSWKGIRKGLPKGVERGARKIGHAMIVGGATALMAHLAGPLAALGTLVSSFAPLGKIAKDLSDGEDADDSPDEPEDR